MAVPRSPRHRTWPWNLGRGGRRFVATSFIPEGTLASIRTHIPSVSAVRPPRFPPIALFPHDQMSTLNQLSNRQRRFSGSPPLQRGMLSRCSTFHSIGSCRYPSQGPHFSVQRDVRGRIILAFRARDGSKSSRRLRTPHASDHRRCGARLVPKRAVLHRSLPRAHGRIYDAHYRPRPRFQSPAL
jgi:hypothetical protein